MKQPILIVGGGLGGLTTALALAQRGWPVRVLEGAPEFGAIGYGIQFGPNIFHVFDRIGVTANNVTYAVLGESFRYWDFFPAEHGWGLVPLWGFADVVGSAADGVAVAQEAFAEMAGP